MLISTCYWDSRFTLAIIYYGTLDCCRYLPAIVMMKFDIGRGITLHCVIRRSGTVVDRTEWVTVVILRWVILDVRNIELLWGCWRSCDR